MSQLLPPEWTNEKVIKFLEFLETERVIWDPHDKNHKLKHKVHDAWNRISSSMDNTPIEELKLKKKSLMATFRPLLKKKKSSIRSGAGADDVFQPIWFGFEIMERFLGTIYDVEETMNTEAEHSNLSEDVQSQQDLPPPSEPQAVPSSSQAPDPSPPVHTKPNKAKKKASTDEAENKITQTLDTLNQVLKDKRNHTNDEDECDMYAKLLAKRLRKYPESMRARIMYQIDGFLLQNPYPVDLPSSVYQRRSSSSQSQYSDYQTSTPSPVHGISQTTPGAYSRHTSTPSPVHVIPQTTSGAYSYSRARHTSSSQSQYSDYQTSTPSPVHVIPQTQQSQHVYVMRPAVSQSSVQLSIPDVMQQSVPEASIEITIPNVMQQSESESAVQLSIPETNVTPQNQMSLIERAYWNATQI